MTTAARPEGFHVHTCPVCARTVSGTCACRDATALTQLCRACLRALGAEGS